MESCLAGGSILVTILAIVLALLPLILLARISHWSHKTFEQTEYIARQMKWLCENEQRKAQNHIQNP